MSRSLAFASLLSVLLISGCSYFRLPVLQGNIVDYDKVEEVRLGMTPRQVEFLLGTPLIRDSFGTPRWDYVVYYRNPNATVLQKNLSIYFENETVSQIQGRDELLADWRKQKAAIKQAKEVLETPHPGQFPAANNKTPADPADPVKPHPVLPPADPAVREEVLQEEQPAEESPAADESSSVPTAQPTEEPATRPPAQPKSEASEQSARDEYPPDMTTIYKK